MGLVQGRLKHAIAISNTPLLSKSKSKGGRGKKNDESDVHLPQR
jgi:hypothetical protein